MKAQFYFFLTFISIGFIKCTNKPSTYLLSGNINSDLSALLQKDDYEVAVMDSTIQSSREMELSYQMQMALEKNKVWYEDYLSNYRESRVLPYHHNFGLTKDEYNELMNMKLKVTLVASSKSLVTVLNENGVIHFDSHGAIPYLDNIKINIQKQNIEMDQKILEFSDTIYVANENHGLKSRWKGYNWKYNEPLVDDTISDGLYTKNYSISIGQLYKDGSTLITISKREEADGELTVKFDKPLVFRKCCF